MKEILWIRELSCGHERPTNIAFACKKYDKPIVGKDCYCRQCLTYVEIIGVRDALCTKDDGGKMEIKEAIKLNNDKWNKEIFKNYTRRNNYDEMVKILNSRKRKDVKILIKAMLQLNKKIEKLKSQEIFLNELLDERERELDKLKKFLECVTGVDHE